MRRPALGSWFSVPYSTIFAAVTITTAWLPASAAHLGAQTPEQHHSETLNKGLTDQICNAIRADLEDYSIDGLAPFDRCQIEEFTSATGDGVKTALADIGGVGASTDAVVVYRLDHGAVAAAKFKDRKGHVSKGSLFLQGSSVTHSAEVILSSSQHVLFTMEIDRIKEDGSAETCDVHAYRWVSKFGMYVERASRKNDEVRCSQ
jgi:hypothetical protein